MFSRLSQPSLWGPSARTHSQDVVWWTGAAFACPSNGEQVLPYLDRGISVRVTAASLPPCLANRDPHFHLAMVTGPEVRMSTKLGHSELFQGKGTSFQVLDRRLWSGLCSKVLFLCHKERPFCKRRKRGQRKEADQRERLNSGETCVSRSRWAWGWHHPKKCHLCESTNNRVCCCGCGGCYCL